ncbi:feruloyl esterase, putative [Talaromyces stipitatus ATCC 10500]|uniref:Feruloyl esterase C n=1 Tax=Talaromyces stipitatus (strain ATCC 10500 / CBS 375.48 / QM 6759 / NRRL 1006) TaxID=441959 RepID=FAEC_TALSN|nr:feruloyl esterase, putative [Talaromyces stipitatus ATCC 10500]B8LV47.1 RecName: Full=Feruloyl esterase C; AltName: Full=Ferulic acid esterase C; Short=FAE; Flags: Precursor [Talaromyces stipitatus ATCC 10500]EED23097.1 feruloyl esterase, putative [Talaromyces stipitatus ATCC 10500]CAD44531.1 ferulic acid esterase [Talaromyces stipitatus]
MMLTSAILLLTLGVQLSHADDSSRENFSNRCDQLAKEIHIPNVTVNFVEYVANGTNVTLADNPPSCGQSNQVVLADLCRVAMEVTTSNQSQITLEAWFPENYTGRFLSTGNGGLAGCIQYVDMAYASSMGFATVGANGGHNGTSGESFYHNPDIVEDLSWRSVHTGVVVGKELTKKFYHEGFHKSYYLGCSTGGRQGFKAVQEFVHDFDGVVAGCPAFNFVNLNSWSGHFYPITGNSSADTFLTTAQWTLVQQSVMEQCDSLDGAVDGVIEAIDQCHPVFEQLICRPGQNASECLTGKQVNTAQLVLSPIYGTKGEFLYPRMQPGVENVDMYITYNGDPFAYSTDWYKYVVFSDPNWDPATLNAQDYEIALAQNPSNIQTFEGDLSAFRDAGAKVLTYHGTADPIITGETSKVYYRHVAETMNAAPEELDEFYRYFRIGGMSHCGGGTGATAIGNVLSAQWSNDPDANVLMAMVRWVEEGVAPEYIRGASLGSGPGAKVEYTRRHCKYPTRNVYVGPGNWTDENAWKCIL